MKSSLLVISDIFSQIWFSTNFGVDVLRIYREFEPNIYHRNTESRVDHSTLEAIRREEAQNEEEIANVSAVWDILLWSESL